MITGLVVAGGGFQGLPMLRALRALGARTVVADSLRHNVNQFEADAYVVVPPAADRTALQLALRRLCEEWHVDVVFPTTDYDLPVVAEIAAELRQRGIVVAAPGVELVTSSRDKAALLEALGAAGLPVLPQLRGPAPASALPLLGKPRVGWGSRGLITVNSAEEHAAAVAADRDGRLFWQRKLPAFTEWSVDFAIDERGRVSPLVARERLRVSGGFAVVSRVDAAAPVHAVARRAAEWLVSRGACGVMNLQILVEPSGAQWLNDVNLRPGTSSVAALGGGVNLAAFMIGGKAPAAEPRSGLLVRTLCDSFVPLPFDDAVEGVVFDLDDCLIDQKAWMDEKLSIVMREWSDFAEPVAAVAFEREARRLIDEGPWDRLLDIAVRRSGVDETLVSTLIERWRAAHPAMVTAHADAQALVAALRRAGRRVAVVTDNPAASQRQKLERLPFRESLDVVVLTAELRAAKPSPLGYTTAAARLKLPPTALIAIGDSPWRDALGALAAGFSGAVIAPRREGMGNPARTRFERAHPAAAQRVHWVENLRAVPRMLGLAAYDA